MKAGTPGRGQALGFLWLYALAWAGGSIAYVPFLSVLLPLRVTGLAGNEDVTWLAYIAFVGAIAASVGNIGFGWLSDVTRNRRGWIAGGLIASCLLLVSVPVALRLAPLLLVVALWQLALNMMLAPLAAWAGDCVPHEQKGLLGGLLSISPAMGALAGAALTWPGLAAADPRLWLVAGMVVLCVVPVLVFGRPVAFPELMVSGARQEAIDQDLPAKRNPVIGMWLARLLVQIAEATLFAYLFFWFRSLDPSFGGDDTARTLSFVLITAVPLTMLAGRWADARRRPILPLAICAGVSACGLAAMAASGSLFFALGGYVVFGVSAAIFLSLHSAQALRVLPRPERRGRDLGIFNLTNTVPSLIMPWLALALVPQLGFPALFTLLAALSAAACLLLLSLSR